MGLNRDTSTPAKVLVVDDEDSILDVLKTTLKFVGYEVETAASGSQALAKAPKFLPDALLLDIMLPDTSGFDLLTRLRKNGLETPVLFLTARDSTDDKVTGLKLGGDDYITKPFSLEEVVARLEAVLRRTKGQTRDGRLQYGDLELDQDSHRVMRGDRSIELSPTEFTLLHYLLLNSEKVMSKSQILDHVWQYDFGGDANIVETYISYLRKKIDIESPPLIHTVRGFGYVLRRSAR